MVQVAVICPSLPYRATCSRSSFARASNINIAAYVFDTRDRCQGGNVEPL
jgi:hypothetical protein